MCCISTRFTRKWDGCMRGFRRGSRSTFKCTERSGVAEPTNGSGGTPVPAAGQLLCVDRGLGASPNADEPAVGEKLGRTAEWIRGPVESGSRPHVRALPHQLLLDGVPNRV